MAPIKLAWPVPLNAFCPVTISYTTPPNAKMSVLLSASLPSNCSGAMYWSVPRMAPSAVRFADACVGIWDIGDITPLSPVSFANPKSSSFTPDLVIMMLPGFRSR